MDRERDLLEKAIAGEIRVTLGAESYPLGYPMYAIELYKQETAKLNCRRARQAEDAGRSRLTLAELRGMRTAYRQAVADLENKTPAEFAAIMEEVVDIRSRLDEESGSGDSLFQLVNWWKIHEEDPDRVQIALWCGLHREQKDQTWKSPLSISDLRNLVDFRNIAYVLTQITRALTVYMPRTSEKKKDPDQGAQEERKLEETTATR